MTTKPNTKFEKVQPDPIIKSLEIKEIYEIRRRTLAITNTALTYCEMSRTSPNFKPIPGHLKAIINTMTLLIAEIKNDMRLMECYGVLNSTVTLLKLSYPDALDSN